MNPRVASDRPSALQPDWTREQRTGWEPSKALLKTIRDYQAAPRRSLAAKWAVLRHRFWSVVTGADIPLNAKIGGGLMLPHPNGVVVHPDAVIGPNCLLFQQVTIGDKLGGVPRLGGHVDVGAGAKLIGGIEIGDHAKIGAGAIVTIDVPEGATAVGNPARIVERKTICASSDDEARSIAISKFGAETVSRWGIYREDGTSRIVVCRNFHALEGPEIVEYLDQLDAHQASHGESAAR